MSAPHRIDRFTPTAYARDRWAQVVVAALAIALSASLLHVLGVTPEGTGFDWQRFRASSWDTCARQAP